MNFAYEQRLGLVVADDVYIARDILLNPAYPVRSSIWRKTVYRYPLKARLYCTKHGHRLSDDDLLDVICLAADVDGERPDRLEWGEDRLVYATCPEHGTMRRSFRGPEWDQPPESAGMINFSICRSLDDSYTAQTARVVLPFSRFYQTGLVPIV